MHRFFSPSTYLDICTLVDQMINENWMGVTTGIATEIKTMLSNAGLDASQCPQPPQSLTIDHQTIHLPEIPAALSHFAAVRKLFLFLLLSDGLSFQQQSVCASVMNDQNFLGLSRSNYLYIFFRTSMGVRLFR